MEENEIFKNKSKEELKQELIECGLKVGVKMEEDIKVLEEMLDIDKYLGKFLSDNRRQAIQDNFYDYYAQNYLQIPVSFLTEENLDWLEQHCEKAIRYATRNELKEHQITLELIVRYKEMNKEIRDLKENKEDYIPKSKVREKIEELEEDYKEYENSNEWEIFDETKYAYELLQELLEEGDDK